MVTGAIPGVEFAVDETSGRVADITAAAQAGYGAPVA
jgi:hypothetical protein